VKLGKHGLELRNKDRISVLKEMGRKAESQCSPPSVSPLQEAGVRTPAMGQGLKA
jgi:hypothetical protein